jgi:hypothetical protein
VQVTASRTAVANESYEVTANGATAVAITLPTQISAGQTVSVTGVGSSRFSLVPAANQTILTAGVLGNSAPGATYTTATALGAKQFHWISSNAAGDVLVATDIPGDLNVSTDGGRTWSRGDSPRAQIWISVDMTPTADRIVAVALNGGVYQSTNRGVNWTEITSITPLLTAGNNAYESVTISADGQRIAINVLNAGIYVSSNAGATWTKATQVGGAALDSGWRGIDSSADGQYLTAVSQNNVVYTSTDFGATWTLRPIVVGGVPITDSWYRVAMSSDGGVIAIAGNAYGGSVGTGLYISRDRGLTWSAAAAATLGDGNYTAIDISDDGQVIGVTKTPTGGNSSGVFLSTDGGATFTARTPAGADTLWRAIALSADGNAVVVAAGEFFASTGQLYTSLGNRTSVGSLGSLEGGQNQSVTVTFEGTVSGVNRFRVTNSGGGAFTIR